MASDRSYSDQSLKNVIREMLKNSGMEKRFDQLEIIKCYHECVGSLISKHTREIFMRNKTLVIKIDSGALKEELSYHKTQIAALINDKIGAVAVEDVQVW